MQFQMEVVQYLTGANKTKWTNSTLYAILKNEKYCGVLLQQKTITVDYLTHKKVKNKNLAPKYHIENNHEAIIDKDSFFLAQKIREDRAKNRIGEDKNTAKYTKTYPFTSMIICSECGRPLKRRYWNYGKPSARVMQQCGGYIEGKGNCKAKATYQEVLEGATLQMLNEVFIKNIHIIETIQNVIKSTIIVNDVEIKINERKEKREQVEEMLSNLVDMKMKTPSFSEDLFNTKYQQLSFEIKEINHEINSLEQEYVKNFDTTSRLSKIKASLQEHKGEITEIETNSLRAFIYKIITISPSEVVYLITGKKRYSDQEITENRKTFINLPEIAKGNYESPKYSQKMSYKVVII